MCEDGKENTEISIQEGGGALSEELIFTATVRYIL